MADLIKTFLDDFLELLGQTPKALVYESAHPYKYSKETCKEVAVEGVSKYSVFFDHRCSTEPGYDFLTFYGDPNLTQVIAKCSGSKPWQPLEIGLPRFYFNFRGVAW